MKLQLGATGVLALAGVAVAGLVLWKASKAASAAADVVADVVTHDLNPADSGNVVNRQVEALGRSITGQQGWTLGGAIYDATHTDQADPTRNTIADSITETITAPGRALGRWVYDLTH